MLSNYWARQALSRELDTTYDLPKAQNATIPEYFIVISRVTVIFKIN